MVKIMAIDFGDPGRSMFLHKLTYNCHDCHLEQCNMKMQVTLYLGDLSISVMCVQYCM